jgi:hypothetical protein
MRACDTAAVVPSLQLLLVAVTGAPYKRHLSTQSRQPELLSPTPEGAAPQLLYVLVIYLHLASSHTARMRKSAVNQHLQEHIRWSPLRQHMQQRHTILYGASCLCGMLLTALEQLQLGMRGAWGSQVTQQASQGSTRCCITWHAFKFTLHAALPNQRVQVVVLPPFCR